MDGSSEEERRKGNDGAHAMDKVVECDSHSPILTHRWEDATAIQYMSLEQ